MAIAATYLTVATGLGTSSTSVYTTAAATAASYLRDLVLTNSGTVTCFVSFGTAATSAATASSFQIPAGGSVILTQSQVPNAAVLYVQGAGSPATFSVGYGSVVSVI